MACYLFRTISVSATGSMKIEKVIWWQHNSKAGQYSSATVHRSVTIKPDGNYELQKLEGLMVEELDGF